jgi:hypothetical protein
MIQRIFLILPLLVSGVLSSLFAHEGQEQGTDEPRPSSGGAGLVRGTDWATGEDISLGGILFPNFHFSTSLGASSGNPEELAVGHHDPNREGITVQNIEFGSSLRAGEYLEGFATYAAVIDHDDAWAGSLEEAFGKIKNLPWGFEVRGGRYYNRFGFYNNVHPHAYMFVNRDLLEARMLGEDSVTTEGGEVSWRIPGNNQWNGALSLSYGRAFLEEEEHGEEEEEALFEPEGAFFDDDIFSADLRVTYHHNDFHQWMALASYMTGDNAYGRSTDVYALGVEYQWRGNGFEAGGRHFRWRAEAIHREAGAVGTSGADRRQLDESGVATTAMYGFNDRLQTGIQGAWVEGIADAGLSERYRVSPLVQWNLLNNVNLRAQYDYDHGSDFGDEHSVWLQLNVSWGGAEVR